MRKGRWSAIRWGAVWLIAASASVAASALDPDRSVSQYGLDSWTTNDGLSQNSVTGVLQGPRGYLWVATLEGVARFDGVRFQSVDLRERAGLADQVVTTLGIDGSGRLWAGTLGGGIAWLTSDQAGVLGGPEGPSRGRVWAIHGEGSGLLWVGTTGGLLRIEGGREAEIPGFAGLGVHAVGPSEPEGLWVGTSEGLRRLRGDEVTTPLAEVEGGVRSILRDGSDALWIGTMGSGLYRWDGRELRRWTTQEGLPHDYVNVLHEDRDGNLWIGTRGGLVRRRGEGFSEPLLPDANILTIGEDHEGSLWLGTQTAGLNRLRNRRVTPLGLSEGLRDEVVSSVARASDGGAWLGTAAGGLHRFGIRGEVAPIDDPPLPSQRVLSVLEAGDGTLWISTAAGLVERRPPPESDRIHGAANGLAEEVVLSLHEDRRGRLWAGTNGGGVGVWDGRRWTTWTEADGLASGTVYGITESPDGRIWLATQKGLARIEDGSLRVWTTADGLPSELLLSLHVDPRGSLWIGTLGGGLIRFDGDRFAVVDEGSGLYDDTVYSILADDRDGLWLCSNRGVFRVDRRELDAVATGTAGRLRNRAFDQGDGMPASECNGGNQPSAARLSDGRLAFATLRGVALLDPARMTDLSPPPAVAIEQLRADGQEYEPGEPPLRLPPGVRHVEIDYTALSFLIPDRIRFRYRLGGYEDPWTEAGTRRTAFYTGLPPGRYRLEVVASSHDGVWGSQGAVLPFSVTPYFWQTTWFPVFVGTGLVLLGWGGHRFRLEQLRARQQELEGLVAERTEQLARANRKLAKRAAEDGLTGLANHRAMQGHLQEEWQRAVRNRDPLAFVLLDLDGFKLFNDTYGHQAGDQCLRRVAEVLAGHARRPADLAARYGGEELALVLPGTDTKDAMRIAEAVRRDVESLEIPHVQGPYGVVTVSIGVAASVAGEGDPEALVADADAALYRAKAEGRNRVCGPRG